MSSKKTLFVLITSFMGIIFVLSGPEAEAEMYACPDGSGSVEYTNAWHSGCQEMVIGGTETKPEPPPSSSSTQGGSGAAGTISGNYVSSEVTRMRQTMLSDPEIMDLLLSLQNDPDLIKILQDPAIMRAVSSGNISALESNPAFMKLMNNKKIQQIEQKMQSTR